MKKILFFSLLALFFAACGDDSSTSANNSDVGVDSSKSSNSMKSDPGIESGMTSSSSRHSGLDPESSSGTKFSSSSAKYSSSIVAKSSSSSATSSSDNVIGPVEVTVGSITDSRDGQTYKTVKIGTQTWIAENLNYKADSSKCGGGNEWDEGDCSKYGRLYTWAAAMDSVGAWSSGGKGCGLGSTCSPTGTVRGICPEGWHLPDSAEWLVLIDLGGGEKVAGKILKSSSGWNDDEKSVSSTDEFLFSALPAGYFSEGGHFDFVNNNAFFWSSTKIDSNYVYGLYLHYNGGGAYLNYNYNDYGFSVRCLKDDVSEQSAKSSSSSVKSSSSSKDSGLVEGALTDSRDGQTYKTVTIGSQTWMAQNLNYKTTNSFCYESSAENCEKYGRLYLWSAAMDSVGTWSTNGKGCGDLTSCSPTAPVRGVCPESWHLPSKSEWETLFTAVGGESTASKVLKSTSGWNGNGNGTDDFGFSALSAGYRFVRGDYDLEGSNAYFWSSTENDNNRAILMSLNSNDGNAILNGNYKFLGLSVRCLKDYNK